MTARTIKDGTPMHWDGSIWVADKLTKGGNMTDENNMVASCQDDMSASIQDLTAALVKVQAAIKPAAKKSENPFFHSKYADLTEVWNACRDALTTNGLAVIQTTSESMDGIVVVTTLAHVSGQWIRGKLLLKPVKPDPQGIGSCITYGRRYALAAIVGVCTDDDDGAAASGTTAKKAYAPPPADVATPVAPVKAIAPPPAKARARDANAISAKQRGLLFRKWREAGLTDEVVRAHIFANYGVKHTDEIPKDRMNELLEWIDSPTAPEDQPDTDEGRKDGNPY